MGSNTKITPPQVWIVSAVLSVIAVVVIYFVMIKPQMEQKQSAETDLAAQTITAEKMPKAKQDRVKAEQQVAEAKLKWARYDRVFMPNIDISNLLTGIQELWHEEIEVLGPKVLHYLNEDKSIEVLSQNIAVAAPPSDPNAVNKKAFVFDLGAVSVVGTFDAVLKHAERWNRFDRLMLVDDLSLSGNSPRLVGQYTLHCFEFTHGEKAGAAIPQSTAPTLNSGGGAGGGGQFDVGGQGIGGPPIGGGGGPSRGQASAPGGGGKQRGTPKMGAASL